jgi:hypothetical protein
MRSLSRIGAALLGTVVLAFAGCASAPKTSPEARSAELLSSRPSPMGRVCRTIEFPAQLPAAGELLDMEPLAADLAELRGALGDTSYALFSMRYDKFGTNIRRAVIEHNLGAALADSVQKLVFKHRQTLPESDGEWGVRMRIGLGPSAPKLEVGRQEICAPRPRDSHLAMAMENTFGASTRYRSGYRESTVWVRLLVSPQGTVSGASIERGLIPTLGIEQRIFDHVRGFFFEPALEDGHPVSGSISVPVVVRLRQ